MYLENGIKQEFLDKFEEPFIKINDDESLEELHDLINQIETKDEIIFRANHGSNAYTVKGTFPQDKQEMLDKIEWMKQHPDIIKLLYSSSLCKGLHIVLNPFEGF